jgi:hypothetical protein
MTKVLKVQTDNDGVVYFELDAPISAAAHEKTDDSHIISELDARLADALAMVSPAASCVVGVLKDLNPERLTVQFGVKLDAALGAIIAPTSVGGHFSVTLTVSQPC